MTTHTPGPWFVEVDDQSGIGRTRAVYVCSTTGWPEGQLARVNIQDGLGEREANARLIAAAPDLLAACEALVAKSTDTTGDWSREWNAALSAIARAKGE